MTCKVMKTTVVSFYHNCLGTCIETEGSLPWIITTKITGKRNDIKICLCDITNCLHNAMRQKKYSYKLTTANNVLWQNWNNLRFSVKYCSNNQRLVVPMLVIYLHSGTPSRWFWLQYTTLACILFKSVLTATTDSPWNLQVDNLDLHGSVV